MLSSTALRLSALVAAAMSAGYLWRAAVEPHVTSTSLLVVPPAMARDLAEVPFDSLELLRRAQVEQKVPVRAQGIASRVRRDVKATHAAHVRSAQFVSVTTTAPQAGHEAPASGRSSTHPVRAKPSKRKRAGKPKPPAPPPRPNPPPPPPPQPPPPAPPPPVAPPAPPPPPPPPVAAPESRPGRGRGDRNHRHTGPPGQNKPKRKEDARQGGSDQGNQSGEQGRDNGRGNGRKEKKGR